MANLFDDTANKIKGSPFVIWVCTLLVAMFFIGIICFMEDTISSRNGIEALEQVFGIKPTNLPIAYFAVSLIPQVGQAVLSYMYLMDRKKNWWALPLTIFFFSIDFVFDVQDRSNQQFIPLERTILADGTLSPVVSFGGATIVASAFTLTAYTLGSELFLSVSIGMFLSLVKDGIKQAAILYVGIANELASARSQIAQTRQRNPRPSQGGPQKVEPTSGGQTWGQGKGWGQKPPGDPKRPQNGQQKQGGGHQPNYGLTNPPVRQQQGQSQGQGQRHQGGSNGNGHPSQRPIHPATEDELNALFEGMEYRHE